MKIGAEQIVTPDENPISYHLDWRYRVAQAMVRMCAKERKRLGQTQDADVRALLQCLLRTDGKPTACNRVIGLKQSGASVLLEVFLLVADSYETVASELGLSVKEVALYGRLFFDVRDDQGKTRHGVLMRLKAELQTQEDDPANRLRRIALTGGIHGLRRVLYGSVQTAEPDLDQLVETELTRRLHAGELRTGDLVRLQANAITRERIAVDNRDINGKIKGTESMEAVLHILSLTAPIIVQADHSPDREAGTNERIKGRLDAQRTTSPNSLAGEPDKGYQKLTELMAAQFKKPEY